MSGSIAALILAAGGSSRMGSPKALLELDGEPLLLRQARVASEAGFDPVWVVLGAWRAELEPVACGAGLGVIPNPRWEEGIGSSIAAGVEALGDAEGVAMLVVDQPTLAAEHLLRLREAWEGGADPVATAWGERPGVPAIFGRRWFGELAALSGDRGARAILERAGAVRIAPSVPLVDVDTPEEWDRFNAGRARE